MQTAIRATFIITTVATLWPVAQVSARDQQSATCVGIAMPAAEGIKGDTAEVETAVRELLVKELSGSALKAVALEARRPSDALEEAGKASCNRVLTTKVQRKAAGGGTGVLGKVAEGAGRSAAWGIPGSGIAGGAARGAALAGVDAFISQASFTKANDEMRIQYQLVAGGGAASAGPQTERLKADADGEDLLTPLVRKVAERVHATVTAR